MRKLLYLTLCSFLLGCGRAPLPPYEMTPSTHIYSQLPTNTFFDQTIGLGKVQVAKEADTRTAPVREEAYKKALESALLSANLAVRSQTPPLYILEATLLEVNFPFWALSIEATAKAHYQLTRVKDQAIIFSETLLLSETVPFSVSFDGDVRTRLAVSKAIRENITHFIRLLTSKPKPTF